MKYFIQCLMLFFLLINVGQHVEIVNKDRNGDSYPINTIKYCGMLNENIVAIGRINGQDNRSWQPVEYYPRDGSVLVPTDSNLGAPKLKILFATPAFIKLELLP